MTASSSNDFSKDPVLFSFVFSDQTIPENHPRSEHIESTCSTLFHQIQERYWENDCRCFEATIGVVEGDTHLQKLRKAFIHVMGQANFNHIKNNPKQFHKTMEGDLFGIYKQQYQGHLKVNRLILWRKLAERTWLALPHTIETASAQEIKQISAADVKKMFRTWISEHQEQLQAISFLDLGYSELTALPPELTHLSNLKYLDLGFNILTHLPKAIGNLTNLQYLILNFTKLIQLPEAIGNLTQLQHLDLRLNKLTSLPEAIGNLTNLQHLDLNGNQLT